MASLDDLEGELVETGVLILFVVVALLVFAVWTGVKGLDPTKWWKDFWNALKSFFSSISADAGASFKDLGKSSPQSSNGGVAKVNNVPVDQVATDSGVPDGTQASDYGSDQQPYEGSD